MTTLAITRRPIVLETQASGAMLTEILGRIEQAVGRMSLYGVTDVVRAKLLASTSIEAVFATSLYRTGFALSSDPSVLPSWTFSRTGSGFASNLSGELELFATAVPRVTDKGLLVERATTNILLRSEELDNAAWTKTEATISPNFAIAPDGATTLDGIIESGTSVAHLISQSAALAPHGAVTYSGIFRTGARNGALLSLSDNSTGEAVASFNLETGAVISSSAGGAWTNLVAFIKPLARGCWWCGVTATKAAGTTVIGSAISLSNGAATYAGDGQIGISAGCMQISAGYPRAYVPTTTAAATRGADQPTITLPARHPITITGECVVPPGPNRIFALHNPSTGNYGNLAVLEAGSGNLNLTVFSSSVVVASLSRAGATVGGRVKFAVVVGEDDVRLCVNGGAVASDDNILIPSGADVLRIGWHTDGDYLDETISRLAVLDVAASDAEMQAMTS